MTGLGTLIALLDPVFVALFWAIILVFQRGRGNEAKRFLSIAMISVFVIMVSNFFFFLKLNNLSLWIDGLYNLASQSLYPLFYIYILMLTTDRRFSVKKHGRYLVLPVVVFLLVTIGYMIMGRETGNDYISLAKHGGVSEGKGLRYMKITEYLARIIFISQVLVYSILSFKLIRRHNEILTDYYSETEFRNLKWVQLFNICLFLLSGTGVIMSVIGRRSLEDRDGWIIAASVIFSCIIFGLGMVGLMQKAALTDNNIGAPPPSSSDERIPERLVDDLKALFEKERCYLNKDLKIWDVTNRLGTNRTYVSRVINSQFGLNFCSFVNTYRIKHAKGLLASEKQYSVDEIADLSGFGSVNSLYRAFVASEKISLSEYRKKNLL